MKVCPKCNRKLYDFETICPNCDVPHPPLPPDPRPLWRAIWEDLFIEPWREMISIWRGKSTG